MADQASGLKLYFEKGNPLGNKILIVAEFVGVKIETPTFIYGNDNLNAKFLLKSPLGKVPCLETPEGCLTESNAIARYVAQLGTKQLYTDSLFKNGQIEQWIEFTANDIVLPASVWIFPILGFIPGNPTATQKAKGDIRKVCDILDKHLKDRVWLVVDEKPTLADIVVAMSLYRIYTLVMDPPFRKSFPNTNRWFMAFCDLPQVKAILGETQLCEKMKVADLTVNEKSTKKENNTKKEANTKKSESENTNKNPAPQKGKESASARQPKPEEK